MRVLAFGAKKPEPPPLIANSQKQTSSLKNRCVCPMIYMPVCGEDKKTYSNACNAQCANIKIIQNGNCLETDDKEKN